MIEFTMPSLGADMEAGTLRKWLVKPGDRLSRGDIIAEVETQKGLIEIEIFEEGKVDSLLISVDEKVPVGAVMALIDADKKAKEQKLSSPVIPLPASARQKTGVNSMRRKNSRVKISPLARKIAAQNNIDISTIKGSGKGGAITKEDITLAIAQKEPARTSTKDIRSAIASAMSKSNREIPHYYLEMKMDMRQALAWLAETNKQRPVKKRILLTPLLMKAVANSLQQVPELNATWENGIHLKERINPGLVISLKKGGIVIPAVLDANRKSTESIMEVLSDLIPRARAFQLKSSELSDSSITITALGNGGSDKVFGVIYPPQVALVGFGGIREEPWAENGMLDVRPVMTVSLAADHRATDGHTGDRFLMALRTHLLNPHEL